MSDYTSSKIAALRFFKTKIEDKYFASGLVFKVSEIGEESQEVADVMIDGEEMKPIREAIIKAIESSLKRRIMLREAELTDIKRELEL